MASTVRAGIQLYSLYDSSESVSTLVRRAGEAGFEGVEFAHKFGDVSAGELNDALTDADVEPVALHADIPILEDAIRGNNDILDKCDTIGIDRVVVPHPSPRYFRTRMMVSELATLYSRLANELDTYDIRLLHHTSRSEFWPMVPDLFGNIFDKSSISEVIGTQARRGLGELRRTMGTPDRIPFQTLAAKTDPETLRFEIDVAETTAGHFDPVEVARTVSGRVPMLHLRDIARTGRMRTYQNVPPGEGLVDFESLIQFAFQEDLEWIIYEDEVDRCPSSKLADGMAFMEKFLNLT